MQSRRARTVAVLTLACAAAASQAQTLSAIPVGRASAGDAKALAPASPGLRARVHAIDAAGLEFSGWIANHLDPQMAAPGENIAALESRLAAPLLGRLPFSVPPNARALASHLEIGTLLR